MVRPPLPNSRLMVMILFFMCSYLLLANGCIFTLSTLRSAVFQVTSLLQDQNQGKQESQSVCDRAGPQYARYAQKLRQNQCSRDKENDLTGQRENGGSYRFAYCL